MDRWYIRTEDDNGGRRMKFVQAENAAAALERAELDLSRVLVVKQYGKGHTNVLHGIALIGIAVYLWVLILGSEGWAWDSLTAASKTTFIVLGLLIAVWVIAARTMVLIRARRRRLTGLAPPVINFRVSRNWRSIQEASGWLFLVSAILTGVNLTGEFAGEATPSPWSVALPLFLFLFALLQISDPV